MPTFLIGNNNETAINNREMELHDIIKDMLIKSREDTSFSMKADVTLEFLEPFRPHSVEFVDDIYAPTREELLELIEFEEEQCIPEEGGNVTLEYKTKAVAFWKSGQKRPLSLQSVQRKFRKVSSVYQLYRWEETVNRVGTRREKLLQISEYVYNKFVDGIETHAIIHGLDLRRWTLQANEETGLEILKASRH